MSLITEDGSVVANAESYVSVANADTYHANRGNDTWGGLTVAEKEEALRRATDYMLQQYRADWKGFRKDGTQKLDWPRSFVYLEPFVHGIVGTYPYLVPDTIVPDEVKNACAELAWRAAAGDLSPDLTRGKLRTQVGPLSVQYDPASPENKRYRSVDAYLQPYLDSTGINKKVIRR